MNIENVKTEINKILGKKVVITVYGLRNKIERYEGYIYKTYPNIFSIISGAEEKSFAYRDIITKDINVKQI